MYKCVNLDMQQYTVYLYEFATVEVQADAVLHGFVPVNVDRDVDAFTYANVTVCVVGQFARAPWLTGERGA